MRRVLLACLLVGAGFVAKAAPLFDIHGGIYTWYAEPTGTIASVGQQSVDIQHDLGLGKKNSLVAYLGVTHSIPFLPNLRLHYLGTNDSASGVLTRTVVVNGVTFTASTPVTSSYRVNMTDATFYYRPLKGPVSMDVGLTVRDADTHFKVISSSQEGILSVQRVFPMVYWGTAASLPGSSFYARAQVNAIAYDSNQVGDAAVKLGWHSSSMVGVEAGYQAMKFKVTDVDDINADVTYQGPYVALSLSF